MPKKNNTARTQAPPTGKKPRRKLDIWNKIAVVILTIFLVGCVSVFFVLVNIINDPEGMRFTRDGLTTVSNSRIFDDSGNIIFEFGQELREDVTYEQLPQSVVDAFLAVEDSRYFEHSGFDLPRFLAAGIVNLESGSFAQGGSTLTMQMIDNSFTKNQEEKLKEEYGGSIPKLDQIKLKIQEIYLSLIAEQTISKEEIIEYYVNRVWFGSGGNTRGIQKAANYYFNKDISDINLSEAAFLAGAVNAPYYTNPLNNLSDDSEIDHLAAATERRDTTLYLMLQHGYITEEEYNLTTNTDLSFALDYVETVSVDPYQAYIDQVITECITLTGQDPTIIPMDIYTAMNASAQEYVDSIMNGDVVAFPNEAFDVGISVLNNKTGEIVAVGPGRNYHSDSAATKQDNSINTRQPGSAMKPLLAYCSTFDVLGWSTNHVVVDKAEDYFQAGFNLNNSDGKYEGNISLAYALGVSKNTTAAATMVELVNLLGINYWIEFCEKLGFDQSVCDMFTAQYCIGGADMFASPIQMSSAYSMFANGGVRINAHRIRRVIRRTDQEEISGNTTEYELISEQAAWLMSDLLKQVVNGGYYNYNNILSNANYTAYGKSGTSDWSTDGLQYGIPQGVIKDEWSIGYTNAFTVATWSGYTKEYFSQGLYITVPVLEQATAFHINDKILQFMADYGDYSDIARPDGISDYNGGYIETQFLNQGDTTVSTTTTIQDDSPTADDMTEEVDEESLNACVGSGGSYNNGACSCPDGYELNGMACEAIVNDTEEEDDTTATTPDNSTTTTTPDNTTTTTPDYTTPDNTITTPDYTTPDNTTTTTPDYTTPDVQQPVEDVTGGEYYQPDYTVTGLIYNSLLKPILNWLKGL